MTDTATIPGLRSMLGALTRERLLDLGRVTGVGLSDVRSGNRRELASLLSAALGEARLPEVLRELGRDELRAVCRAHDLSGEGRRGEVIERTLLAAGFPPGSSIPPRAFPHTGLPQPTDLSVPPCCPRNDEEKAQLAAFEDEVIDRLYVLNAERAREEERLGLGKKGKGAKKAGKGGTKKPASPEPEQGVLAGMQSDDDSAGPSES